MIRKIIAFIIRLIPKKQQKSFLNLCFSYFQVDPLTFAYNRIGILNYQNDIVSGENYFIEKILAKYLQYDQKLIIFDIGANIGKYTEKLSKAFPKSKIYSFEPNTKTFKLLETKYKKTNNVFLYPIGFSSNKANAELITYTNNEISSHSSLYKDLFTEFHNQKESTKIDIILDTIDSFCESENIEKINFVKIDTEGHEYDVLTGAKSMINDEKIDIIQFEFGECDVFSRVFLKDFYELLTNYNLYRMNTYSLIDIKNYNAFNEIFRFQNIVAIHKRF